MIVDDNHNDSFRVAGVGRRLMALLYDGLLILALVFFVATFVIVLGTKLFIVSSPALTSPALLPAWYRYAVMLPIIVLVVCGFYAVFWRVSGQTLGMQTWKIKTINLQGQLLPWPAGMLRCLCALIVPVVCVLLGALRHNHPKFLIFSFSVGFLLNYTLIWFHPRSLALHDWLSGTLTIHLVRLFRE